MKIKPVITGIVACAILAAVSGCKKEEPVASPADTQTKQTADVVAGGVTQAVQTAATENKPAEAVTPTDADVAQTQGLIDRAKGYVAEQKYQDALSSLSQLASSKLTADQQKTVDSLKAQIQSALAKAAGSDPASALGGALGGKK